LAAAVAVLSVTTDATKTLRRVLAQRVATTYPGNKLPPKGWGTPELAKRMAVTPSAYRTPQVESGYSDTGEPWQVVKEGELPAANFDALVIHYLVHFWADVLPHLLIDDRDYTTYSLFYARAGQVLGRVKVDQAPALHKALVQVMRDTTLSEPVRIEAANRLFRGEWPNGLATSWSDRLAAVDTTHEERVIIVQWSVVEKAYHTPLGWYLNLLKGQRGEARCAVAEVIGKMGPEAKDAIPELIMGLKADTIAPAPYVSALAAIGPDSVPALGELMKEKEPKLRTAAAEALGLIGPEGRSKATPILRTAIEQEKDDAVKKAALEALGQVNPVEAKKLGWTAK
jgi:HEAT repeat protein